MRVCLFVWCGVVAHLGALLVIACGLYRPWLPRARVGMQLHKNCKRLKTRFRS